MTLHILKSPLSSLSTLAFFLFLLHLIHSATPLSFEFPNIFDHQGKIVLANNDSHFSSSQGLHLNPNDAGENRTEKAGRASCIKPLRLWDSRSGKLAGFTTSFTFVIDSFRSINYGDGLTFFLAENNFVITRGGALGLPIDRTINAAPAPAVRFAVVEFDTYGDNEWDPSNVGNHVGIDVNSLPSVSYMKWSSSIIPIGLECEATVSYNATTKDLSVVFTGYENSMRVQQKGLRYTVNLRKELLEWVTFGFSASTGALFEKNTVKSWRFKSKMLHVKNME